MALPRPIGLFAERQRGRRTALKLWQIDAFANRSLEGNPAAVIALEQGLDTALMQRIAAQNNLGATAFLLKTAPGRYALQWFSPSRAIDLCGHGTLASAWVIFNRLETTLDRVTFITRSGALAANRECGGDVISLPATPLQAFAPPPGFAQALGDALGHPRGGAPRELHSSAKGGAGAKTLLAVWDSPEQIAALSPGARLQDVAMEVGAGSVVVTAAGDGRPYDMVSRFFAPLYGVREDPVTGSAHCALTPFWAKRLGKKTLMARQASARGGDLLCTDDGAWTMIKGECALYREGEIAI